jgi:hypothetical protein
MKSEEMAEKIREITIVSAPSKTMPHQTWYLDKLYIKSDESGRTVYSTCYHVCQGKDTRLSTKDTAAAVAKFKKETGASLSVVMVANI